MVFGERQKIDCLRILLRPIVKFALRHSVSVQQLVECLKQTIVQLAVEEIARNGKKVNISRLSAMTGMHRRDVFRLRTEAEVRPLPVPLAARVIGQWENDKRFTARNGRPRVLELTEKRNEFSRLLESVSTDLNAGTVLFELERAGLIERRKDSVKLLRAHAVSNADAVDGFRILESECNDLIHIVEENLEGSAADRNLQGRTEFDNLAQRDLAQIRRWLLAEGGKFHTKVRRYLAAFDLDMNPKRPGPGGGRISFSTYGRVRKEPYAD